LPPYPERSRTDPDEAQDQVLGADTLVPQDRGFLVRQRDEVAGGVGEPSNIAFPQALAAS
jgi:hypothetical protein